MLGLFGCCKKYFLNPEITFMGLAVNDFLRKIPLDKHFTKYKYKIIQYWERILMIKRANGVCSIEYFLIGLFWCLTCMNWRNLPPVVFTLLTPMVSSDTWLSILIALAFLFGWLPESCRHFLTPLLLIKHGRETRFFISLPFAKNFPSLRMGKFMGERGMFSLGWNNICFEGIFVDDSDDMSFDASNEWRMVDQSGNISALQIVPHKPLILNHMLESVGSTLKRNDHHSRTIYNQLNSVRRWNISLSFQFH